MVTLAVSVLPSCVGVSITLVVDGNPFTVTATTPEMAVVDASQYLTEQGPCVAATPESGPLRVEDVLDEGRWQDFAQAAAAVGIRSSLSIPLASADGERIGALNLYAGDVDAFRGNEERVAEMFGAHVQDVVRNADLSFMTRDLARGLPQRLDEHEKVNQAVGVLVGRRGFTPERARERMGFAARQAGIPLAAVADLVMILGTG